MKTNAAARIAKPFSESRTKKREEEVDRRNAEQSRYLRQSELAFLGPSSTPPVPSTLITDFALKYRPNFRHQVCWRELRWRPTANLCASTLYLCIEMNQIQ